MDDFRSKNGMITKEFRLPEKKGDPGRQRRTEEENAHRDFIQALADILDTGNSYNYGL